MSDPHAHFGHNKPKEPDKPLDPFDQCVADVLAKLEASSGLVPPKVRNGVETAVKFFHDQIAMPYNQIASDHTIGYLKGIDWHSPVTVVEFHAGDKLAQFRPPDARAKPFVYYTKPGISNKDVGTNFPSYTYIEACLTRTTFALQSRASGMAWGNVIRPGGGTQFIISSEVRVEITYRSDRTGPRWHNQNASWPSLPAWL